MSLNFGGATLHGTDETVIVTESLEEWCEFVDAVGTDGDMVMGYWHCDCLEGYVKPSEEPYCPICETYSEDLSDGNHRFGNLDSIKGYFEYGV